MLTRGEPTQITVFNRLRFPLAVHWHGIELESYYDGVPQFSGDAGRIAPPIAPGDSFVVRMTPPRAGTFFYHIHSEDGDELNAGLYGALLVLDPARSLDPTIDRTFVLSGGRRPVGNPLIFVNGSSSPDPIEVLAGVTQRWRFISIRRKRQLRRACRRHNVHHAHVARSRPRWFEPGLDLSSLLWTTFCFVERDLRRATQDSGNISLPCARLDRSPLRRPADTRTTEQARAFVRRALDRTEG